MGLATFTPERHEHVMKGNSVISVTGLTLNHIARLIHYHFQDIEALFDLFKNLDKAHEGDVSKIIMGLVSDAPGFVANVIALAADEPDQAEKAEKLPFPVQIELLMKVAEMTFEDVGGLKKGMETIAALLVNLKDKGNLAKTLNTL